MKKLHDFTEEELEQMYWAHNFLDDAPFIALRIGMDGKYIWANKGSLLDMGGITLEQLKKMGPEAVKDALHPDSQPVVAESAQRAMVERTTDEVLVRIKRHGMGYRWLRHISSPWYKLDGTMGGLQLLCLDVTEQKEKEEEQERMMKTMANMQTLEAMGVLAAGIAHDFNNLLQIILGFSELALEKLKPGDQHFEDFTKIRRAGMKASDLAHKLLAFARREGDKENFEPVDPATTAKEALDLFRRGALKKRPTVKIRSRFEKDLPRIFIDKNELSRALINLLKNAMEAVDGREGVIEVLVEQKRLSGNDLHELPGPILLPEPGDYIVFRVKDNGEGMDEETSRRAFEPFFTTKAMQKGTGLGLFATAGVVRRHGGGITLESKPGIGTEVSIFIPVESIDDLQSRREAKLVGDIVQPERLPKGDETILVVDDEGFNLEVAQLALFSRGYEVLRTQDPEEALEWVRTKEIDLALIDVIMPKMGGAELFAKMKEIKPDLKALAVTGYAMPQDLMSMKEQGLLGWIQKPYSINDLCIKVRDALDRDGG